MRPSDLSTKLPVAAWRRQRPYGSPGLGSKYQGQSEPTASAFHKDAGGGKPGG